LACSGFDDWEIAGMLPVRCKESQMNRPELGSRVAPPGFIVNGDTRLQRDRNGPRAPNASILDGPGVGVVPDDRRKHEHLAGSCQSDPRLDQTVTGHVSDDIARIINAPSATTPHSSQCSPVNPDVINVSDKCDQPEDEH
jgi:hypothetical protein